MQNIIKKTTFKTSSFHYEAWTLLLFFLGSVKPRHGSERCLLFQKILVVDSLNA